MSNDTPLLVVGWTMVAMGLLNVVGQTGNADTWAAGACVLFAIGLSTQTPGEGRRK